MLPRWSDISLWPHQKRAVQHLLEYAAAYTGNPRAALIKMPTGTGKSGVMAVVARIVPRFGDVLVLVPWDSVAEQLFDDIKQRFWKAIGIDGAALPKHVERFYPSTLPDLLAKHPKGSLALVGTIQALQMTKPDAFDALRSRVDLVFFDEGHREPAPTWSRTIRAMEKPTALFTATPYRNDHKLFNVEKEFVFNYSHRTAVEEKYIRDLKIQATEFTTENEFVEKLLEAYEKTFPKSRYRDSPPHVIVRCGTAVQIDRIHRRLREAKQRSVAIHHTFTNDAKSARFHSVPLARKEAADAIFWVHQYKLLEGFDDNRCRMLALFEPLDTTRALVQQAGRILRSTNLKARQEAHLLCAAGTDTVEEWNRYLAWDRLTAGHKDVIRDEEIFQRIFDSHPEHTYFQGGFRTRLDLRTVDLWQRLRFKRSVSLFQRVERAGPFDLARAEKDLLEEYLKEDVSVYRVEAPDENTRVFVYVVFANTPVFPNDFLIEYKVGYAFLRARRNYVYYYDSTGIVPPPYVQLMTNPVSPERLRALFPDEKSRLASATLMNTDLGRTSIRRRGIAAYDLGGTSVTLGDHLQLCSNATGYIDIGKAKKDDEDDTRREKTKMRRYVGLTTGRISDEDLDEGNYAAYDHWLKTITEELARKPRPPKFFNRFADSIDPPTDPTPVNILLDLDDFRNTYLSINPVTGRTAPFDVDDVCIDVKPDEKKPGEGTFTLMATGRPHEVAVKYDEGTESYELVSADLDRNTIISSAVRGRQRGSATAFLNREQSFRIVTRTPGIIYAHSRFYQPRLKYFGGDGEERIDLLDLLVGVRDLATAKSEKGKTFSKGEGWNLDTVFGMIDARGRGTEMEPHFLGFDTFVCDDLGRNEVADFIGARTSSDAPRVVLIHAKGFADPRPLSASALAEVASQATKNLPYINPHTDLTPPNLDLWDAPWVWKKSIGEVKRRIRAPKNRKAKTVWKSILSTIRKPGASREVWIVLGNGLSKQSVKNAVMMADPEPQVVQIVYQLLSTWSAVASMGAALRIFCSP